jgi:EAL domain-containing protein (putative c-di-GMP-specific phosphodiesterase class I)
MPAEGLVRLRHPRLLIPPAEFTRGRKHRPHQAPFRPGAARGLPLRHRLRTGPTRTSTRREPLAQAVPARPGGPHPRNTAETAPRRTLEFENHENLLLDNRPETLETLSELRRMGAGIARDDFGKEYSSLSYIKKLPVQAIKIDRSFIDGLPGDEDDASIVKSVLSLAQGLELRVVAEGVETRAQLDFLVGLGCSEFQGYLFSKPLPAVDMQALLGQSDPFPCL